MKIGLPIGTTFQQKKLHQFLNNLLRGAIVIAPIGFTLMAVVWLFNLVDTFLPNLIQHILDFIFNGKVKAPYIPGLGFIGVVFLLAIVGYVSNFFLINKLMKALDAYFEKAPGIKFIYTTLKDLAKNLSGSKKNFDKPVLISIDEHKKIYRMGFVTKNGLDELGLNNFVAVYIPMSFSIAGNVYFVSKEDIVLIQNVDSTIAMKFLISGGVTNLSQNTLINQQNKSIEKEKPE